MIEQSAPLGEDGKDYLAEELLHTTCALRCCRPLSSAPIEARASPTFLPHKTARDTGACMTRAKGPNLWNANGRFRVSSILARKLN